MTIKYDNYTPKDPSSTGRIFFRDYEDERADASAGVGVSYPSGIVSVGLSGNEQNVVDGVSSIIPPVVGTASNPSLKLFSPDDIIAFVAAHETGGGGAVDSVAGRTGDVLLSATDITENGGLQFITDAEVVKLGNLSVSAWSDPVNSNILPSLANDVAFTLGDSDQRFKEIWVSGIHTFSSIDLRGQVFENVGPTSSTLSGVSIAERNAGEETDFRLFSPADISSMALQHGPAAGSITEGALEDLIAGLDASSIQSNDEFLFRVSSGTDELAVTTASGIVTKGLDDLGIDPQSREVATSDPTVDDDIDLGYSSLDLWLNTNNGKFYINEVATDGAAIWREFAPSGVTAQEITDLSATDYRLWTPEDVSSAISQHSGGGGGGGGTSQNLVTSVKKESVGTITIGEVVYVSADDGGTPTVELADADGAAAGQVPFGVANGTITDSTAGEVVTHGVVTGMDTSDFSAGEFVYLSTSAGVLTTTRPNQESVWRIGQVVYSHASTGMLRVNMERVRGRHYAYLYSDGRLDANSRDLYFPVDRTGTVEKLEIFTGKYMTGSTASDHWLIDVQDITNSDASLLSATYNTSAGDLPFKTWFDLGALTPTTADLDLTPSTTLRLDVTEVGTSAPGFGNETLMVRVTMIPDN